MSDTVTITLDLARALIAGDPGARDVLANDVRRVEFRARDEAAADEAHRSAQGWCYPTSNSRKAHFFPSDGDRSLCGRYGRPSRRLATIEDAELGHPENCATCDERAAAALAKAMGAPS